MLNVRSIGFRIAVWYFCSVAAICALAAAGYWLAIRSELDRALDQGLRYRLIGLRSYLEEPRPSDRDEIAARLAEVSKLGELYQVYDAGGELIAQSNGLARHGVPPRPPRGLGHEIRYDAGGTPEFPLRFAWQRLAVGPHELLIGAADPQRKFEGVLTAFTTVLLLSTAVTLGLAALGGAWLARRALAPVERIASDVRSITESNLSARLAVPGSRDELQRLSETLNEMLERIERSFARTRQFTADASHELRAPLTLIHTAAQFALRRERGRDELVDAMQKILRESERTTALIDDLLLLARYDASREPASFAPIDAGRLVRDAAEQARAIAAAKGVHVDARPGAEPLPVRASEAQLRRVLLILVDNAVKYTPAGGRVGIAAGTDAGEVVLSVDDTGPGIATQDLPHVFERFWRADKVRSRDAGGAGLGLAIASQIAQAHGARLTVESEVGTGTVFRLHLPRAGPEASDPAGSSTQGGTPAMRRSLPAILLLAAGLTGPATAASDPDRLARGRELYEQGCQSCHGRDGRGNPQWESEVRPIEFTDCGTTAEPDEIWTTVVKHGGPARGLDRAMPAFEGAYTDAEIAAILGHIRTFCPDHERYPPGELNFRRLLATGKAFPEQELVLRASHRPDEATRETELELLYENRLGRAFQYEIVLPLRTGTNVPGEGAGVGDVELEAKRAVYWSGERRAILALGLGVGLPTGSEAKGLGTGTVSFAPFAAFGKGWGRTVLQAHAGAEIPADAAKADPELRYAIGLSHALGPPTSAFTPAVELVGAYNTKTHEHEYAVWGELSKPLNKLGHVIASVGVQAPIRPSDAAWKLEAYLLWDFGDGPIWVGW